MSRRGLTYGAGALIAAERGDAMMGGIHADALRRGVLPTVPAAVLAQVWRGGPQPSLSRVLKGCRVESLTEVRARDVGRLAAASGHDDVVDLSVVEGAGRRGDVVITSDPSGIERIAVGVGIELPIVVL